MSLRATEEPKLELAAREVIGWSGVVERSVHVSVVML